MTPAGLEEAIAIALEAHRGQVDKAGAPYILHPLRVMFAVRSEPARIVAVLHDVVEDTPWTLEGLAARGFAPGVMTALDSLTHREGESYESFVGRVASDGLATEVKLADLADNLDASRLGGEDGLTARDQKRMEKYRAAWRQLTGATYPERSSV